jgi:IS605 OrfB family transposase
MKATEALKSAKARVTKKLKASCPQSSSCSIRYDANSYNLWLDKGTASLKTVEGRLKVKIGIPEYFKRYADWKWTSADLFVKNGKVFLHVVFEKEFADAPVSSQVVGVDRGINNIAVTSANQFFGGGRIKYVSGRYERLRSELQSKGHSGKRHFRRIAAKERRFRRDVNHCASKWIVGQVDAGGTIVFEKLTGIRQDVRMRKEQRRQVHKWNFFQLDQFTSYKAEGKGVRMAYGSARYTSQKCSCCGHISRSNRKCQSVFRCTNCGFTLHADLNASRNIRQNYLDAIGHPSRADVNQPSGCSGPNGLLSKPLPLGMG